MPISQFRKEFNEQGRSLQFTLNNFISDGFKDFKAIEGLIEKNNISNVIITGMGSSYYASFVMSNLLNLNGFASFVIETTDLAYYGLDLIKSDTLVITVSKSGESNEIIDFINKINNKKNLIGITDEIESTLGTNSNIILRTYAGSEEAPTSKSFICTIGLQLALAYYLIKRDFNNQINELLKLCDLLDNLIIENEQKINNLKEFVGELNYINILGRGPSLAVALQCSLVFKEEAKVFAEGMSSNAFLHGADLLVDKNYLSIVLSPEGLTSHLDDDLIKHITGKNGKVIVVTNRERLYKDDRVFEINIPNIDEHKSTLLQYVPLEMIIDKLNPLGFSNYLNNK